mgnify:CR=1 FL=1
MAARLVHAGGAVRHCHWWRGEAGGGRGWWRGEADGGETALGCYPRKEDGDACAEIGDELEVTSLSV